MPGRSKISLLKAHLVASGIIGRNNNIFPGEETMRSTGAILLLSAMLTACAIEGVGFDGRVNAYRNAATDGREFAALNRGARDAAWYAGWCAAIEPHFQRMSDVNARVKRYCAAMQTQQEAAEAIRQDLISTLLEGGKAADANRSAALGALAISAQMQQAQAAQAQQAQAAALMSRPLVTAPATAIHCTSQRLGYQVQTDCQ
ncbi:hypothetical protein [Paraburkholderia tagetis]|uniref:Uncharacterized protein n=1 Tax=Paraburkholderia tagetis TaxID=2913261 RepID=A0A9X1UMD2_9BURK|nr:hypothetical protein [Paraburkholderia tagetis]MCG5078045.1 hypothetical protein [Paraburkholderia tagetis]